MIRFNVIIDTHELRERADDAMKKAQFALDNEVIKDSNYYAPEDTGMLQGSSLLASNIGKGRIAWNTPYSRRLYYNPQYNFAKDKNPNAQGLWFEIAKAQNKEKWKNIVQQVIDQEM